MKKYLIIIITVLSSVTIYAQDTVYTYAYQSGIVTKSLESSFGGYKLIPIDNPGLEIGINKKEIKNIKYGSGQEFVNDKYKDDNIVVLSTEPTTAKIYYSKVLEFKDAKAKDLFNAIKRIPQGMIKYTLVSSDETEFSFQKYVGSFSVRYAGDPWTVYFNLLLKFKDGKIKYEYSDFVTSFIQSKTRKSFNPFINGVNTTIDGDFKSLDKFYAGSAKNGDKEKFWTPISNSIEDSVKTLKKLCTEATSTKKDDW